MKPIYEPTGKAKEYGDYAMGKRDCTAEENTEENYKYLILRPDCKLYSAWDDPASLIF